MEKQIQISPKFLGPQLHNVLIQKIKSEVEGKCSGRYGFMVAVTKIEHLGKGKIDDSTGNVTFPVKYKAIVFRLFKNEPLDAVVVRVTKVNKLNIKYRLVFLQKQDQFQFLSLEW